MSQNKMPPDQYSQMIKHLTRRKIQNPFIPDSAIERPKRILEIEAFKDFNKRNPQMAEGGRIGFADGTTSKTQTKVFKYPKKFYNRTTKKVETVYSKNPPITDSAGQKSFTKAALDKSEASYKAYEKKFSKSLLDKIALKMHGKKFRELDKESTLKNFKAKIDKYEDFIKNNKRYPNQSEAFQIGMQKAGNKKVGLGKGGIKGDIKKFVDDTYSKGIGGSDYIAKELKKPPYNFKIDASNVRRYLTEEIEEGRLKRPTKFQTQAADPTLPKDRYFKVRPTTSRDFKQYGAPEGSKYKISFKAAKTPETSKIPIEYQGTQYYKDKNQADSALKGYRKFSKDLKKAGEAGRSAREIILRQISDPNVESAIARLKQGEDLATAHRLSYKQVGKLSQLYNIANLGIEDPSINSGAIRRFENKLDRLYEEQRNLIKTAKRFTNKGLPVPKNLQDKIDFSNKKISTVVDLTDRRVQGILIDPKNLKPTTYGIDYMKTYGMGLLKNKNVKDITDADLATIQLNIENQIKLENRLGAKTETFLRDRQKFIKNVDELAGPRGAEVARNIGLSFGRPNFKKTGTEGFIDRQLLTDAGKFLGRTAQAGFLTPTGVAATTLGLGGLDLTSPAGRLSLGAEAAFAPELVKASIGATKGIKNRALQKGIQQALNLGLPTRVALRAARLASPIGIATLAGEGLYQAGKFSRDRIKELQAMTPEQRQELRSQGARQAFDPFQAAGGGLAKQAGDRSGRPPEKGPNSQGLLSLMKRGMKI
jgi:hypothetical protein